MLRECRLLGQTSSGDWLGIRDEMRNSDEPHANQGAYQACIMNNPGKRLVIRLNEDPPRNNRKQDSVGDSQPLQIILFDQIWQQAVGRESVCGLDEKIWNEVR